jgi:RNA binding exosome subunit
MTLINEFKDYTFRRVTNKGTLYFGGVIFVINVHEEKKEQSSPHLKVILSAPEIIGSTSIEEAFEYIEEVQAGARYFYEHFKKQYPRHSLKIDVLSTRIHLGSTTSSCMIYATIVALCEVLDFKIEGLTLNKEGVLIMPLP